MFDNNKIKSRKSIHHFWCFWSEHQPKLQSCCLRWLNGNHTFVEDALSQTIEKAHEYFLKSEEEIRSPLSWLCKIAYTICIDIHREQKKQHLLCEMATNSPDLYFFSMFESEELEEKIQRERLLENVYLALDALPPDLKAATFYRFIDEMEYTEIAESMNITEENVRKRIHLSRQILRTSFI